jgi:predicted nucleic acid-binding protein
MIYADSSFLVAFRVRHDTSALACRSADLLHVAYAKELSAALFVGFDDDQLALARAAGLKTLKPS